MDRQLRLAACLLTTLLWLPAAGGLPLETLNPGIVKLYVTKTDGLDDTGAGIVIGLEKGAVFILTAYHVIEDAETVQVIFDSERWTRYEAEIFKYDDLMDVATVLVRFTDPKALPANLPTYQTRTGEPVYDEQVTAVGHPSDSLEWHPSAESVAQPVSEDPNTFLITRSQSDRGFSGGPVFDDEGALLGIVLSVSGQQTKVILMQAVRRKLEFWKAPHNHLGTGDTQPGNVDSEDEVASAPPPRPPQPVSGTFRDCTGCPEMVVVPGGSFTMGSPESEAGRRQLEGPQHEVTIAPFALGRYEVTREEFAAFVAASGHNPAGCRISTGGASVEESSKSWSDPGFRQTDRHPVTCVSWEDARRYVEWLSLEVGKQYRLHSEAEWEYAARARMTTSRYWGPDPKDACKYANVGDQTLKDETDWRWPFHDCQDGYARTAPAGSFEANGFGLYDMLGNIGEWTQDCVNPDYSGAPEDGSARATGNCSFRVLRGGCWFNTPQDVRAAVRFGFKSANRFDFVGFRVATTPP